MRSNQWWDRATNELIEEAGEDFYVPENLGALIWDWTDRLKSQMWDEQQMRARASLTLYFGKDVAISDTIQMIFGTADFLDEAPPGYNVVQACVDTQCNQILQNRIRPMVLTEAGNAEEQKRAKAMQEAIEGELDRAGLYATNAVDVCFAGNILDGGGMMFVPDFANSRIDSRLVWAHEFLIPIEEQRANKVQNVAYITDVDRDALLSFFKDADEEVRQAILDAAHIAFEASGTSAKDEVADRVEVRQVWHYPSVRVDLKKKEAWGLNPKTKEFDPDIDPGHDGRFCICVRDKVLLDRPWPLDHNMVAWFKPRKKLGSAWSRGLPEVLAAIQKSLNRWQRRVEGILDLHAVPRLIVWNQAKLKPTKFNNSLASILTSNRPPEQSVKVLTPSAVPRELLERIDSLITWGKETAGLPDMAIAAQRPPAIEHEPPMQFLADMDSVRHTQVFKAWEQFYVDAGKIIIECIRQLAMFDPDYEVIFGNDKEMKRHRWQDFDLERDRYIAKVWPTNLLPQTPQAKAKMVMAFLERNLFDLPMALEALDYPDIRALMGDLVAEKENIEQKIEAAMLNQDTNLNSVAHGYLNLPLAKTMVRQAINRAEADGDDPRAIEGLIKLFENIVTLEETAAAAQMQMAQQPAGAPPLTGSMPTGETALPGPPEGTM